MNTLKTGLLVVLLAVLWGASALRAQTLEATFSGPEEHLVNEEICFNLSLSHSGPVGYQPYFRLLLAPEFSTAGFSAKFMGQPITSFSVVGSFSGSTLIDPNLPVNDPNRNVSGPTGYTLVILNLPVGAMVEDGVELTASFCVALNGPGVTIGQPAGLEVVPMYRYGDDPTGVNGSLLFSGVSHEVTPLLYKYALSVDPEHLAAGSCVGTQVDMVVDVANQYQVNGLNLVAQLPPDMAYMTMLSVTPGCVVQQQPAAGASGNFSVLCNNVNGTSNAMDVVASFVAYPAAGPDLASCDSLSISMPVSVSSNQGGTSSGQKNIYAYHLSYTPNLPSELIQAGATVEMGLNLQVSEFLPSIDLLEVDLVFRDGLTFQGGANLNGSPFSPTSVVDLGQGETAMTFDLVDALGASFSPCAGGWLSFQALIENNYFDGSSLAPGDLLEADGIVRYRIAGEGICERPVSLSYRMPAAEVSKEVVSTPANGENYVPGENVTYRITAVLPAGTAGELNVEDLFPIPVHDVSDLSLVFGEAIVAAPTDNSGVTPLSISANAAKNSVSIDWGSLAAPLGGADLVVAVDITIPVVGTPFAPGLKHSNFARLTGANSTSLAYTTISVGAPKLTIFKGILTTDQPDAQYSPIMIPVNANANSLDAYDWITWRITLTNIGDAPAYDVIVNDLPPVPQLNQCELLSVENTLGDPAAYLGDLFTTGLVIAEIPKQVSGNTTNRIHVEYECRATGQVEARSTATNTAEATWVSTPGGGDLFTPISAWSSFSIARPAVEIEVLDILPGYGNEDEVHIGEVVTYRAALRVPEGITRNATLECLLPEGLSVEEVVSYEAPPNFVYQNGSQTQIINSISVSDLGPEPENIKRKLSVAFGNLTNNNSNNNVDEYIYLTFKATVNNLASVQNGVSLVTESLVRYLNPVNGALVTENASYSLQVVEADLDVSLSFFESELLPGGQTFVTLTVGHSASSTTTAYDVELVNDLPLGLQLVPNSFLTECDELLADGPQNSFGSITARWDSIPLGVTCEIVYLVQVVEAFPPCTMVDNCKQITYSSAFAVHMDTLSYGPLHPLGFPRTGNVNQAGGTNNDYLRNACAPVEVVTANLNAPLISGQNSLCAGEALNLSVPSYSGVFVEYQWMKDGEAIDNNSPQLNIGTAGAASAGTYTAQVQIGLCVTPLSAAFEVEVFANPSATVNDLVIPCASGFESVSIAPIASGGDGNYTYVWTGPNYLSTDEVALIQNASEANTGVYTLVVSDGNGCSSSAASALVSITTAPPLPEIQSGAAVCVGESFTLSTAVYPGAQSYNWNTPQGEVITAGPTLNVASASQSSAGAYSVWVQLQNCSTEDSFEVTVEINENPQAPEILSNATSLCAGETLVLSTDADASAYNWSGPNGFSSSSAAPAALTGVSVLASGNYELTVFNGACASETATLSVSVNALPVAPAVSSNSPICAGETLSLNTGAVASNYAWILPGGSEEITAEPSFVVNGAQAEQSGAYTLQIFDGQCWSQPSQPLVVQVDVIPQEQAYAGAQVIACEGEPAMVQAANDPSLQGFWSTPGDELQFASPNSQSSAVSGMLAGEIYLAEWSLYNEGCGVYSSDEVTIFRPNNPAAESDFYELVEGESVPFGVTANDELAAINYEMSISSAPENGLAEVVEGNLVRYRPNEAFYGDDSFVYRVCLQACPDMCDTALVRVRVFPFLRVPDIITPNNDGVNDVLIIEGIDRFPSNELYIYNRWGREVFSATNYQNDWNAHWQGQPLPNGTYFFVLNNRDTGETLDKGYITVHQ